MQNLIFSDYKNLISQKPDIEGKNVRVWSIRQDEVIRINLVEMSGETALHKHPDADHSLMVLEGEVKVQIASEFMIMKKGDYISIPADVAHKYWSLAPKSMLVSMDAPYYDPNKTISLE
jgi:quercetin dioxygenase-like cupin family protein